MNYFIAQTHTNTNTHRPSGHDGSVRPPRQGATWQLCPSITSKVEGRVQPQSSRAETQLLCATGVLSVCRTLFFCTVYAFSCLRSCSSSVHTNGPSLYVCTQQEDAFPACLTAQEIMEFWAALVLPDGSHTQHSDSGAWLCACLYVFEHSSCCIFHSAHP